MARLILFLVLTLGGSVCLAQQPFYNLDSVVKQYSKQNLEKQRDIINELNFEQIIKEHGLQKKDTARFAFANEYGLVYRLPVDNMHFLKPYLPVPNSSFTSKPFPGLNYNPINEAGQIPNPLKRDKLVLESPKKSQQTH